jgi:toxin ParE1/3/4
MAHRVGWSRRALSLSDLEGIADCIAADSPRYASNVVKKVLSQVRILAQFPCSGRKVPEFDDNVRKLIVYSNRVIYRMQANGG